MKKILSTFLLLSLFLFTSCTDELNTEPTDRTSGSIIMKDASSAEVAMNGIYRLMYKSGWSTNWPQENFGQTSINLLADLMGEDHLMREQGQGWFYEDYRLTVHGDYTGKNGRSYAIWNFYYTLISNANYIIAAESTMGGTPEDVKSVIGQAYAIRAFSYYYLAQLYQQTYIGHEQKPGIPLYDKPTIAGTVGKPRGTLAEVYIQINTDINKAISLLQESSEKVQKHPSHIDYYVANGIKARIALTQHEYAVAAAAADEALKRPGIKLISVKDLGGNNSVKSADVLWGFEIIPDQSTQNSSFFSHMDADVIGKYASKARQCISSALYKMIPLTDERMAWWRGELPTQGTGSNVNYCQIKFKMADSKTSTGDYLLMRAEEMVLIKAEALCHQEQFAQARQAISVLGTLRDTKFGDRLATRIDSKEYNRDTNSPLQTLMDEILFQRRVELWGETGRIFDLQRLALGYNRNYLGSNHSQKLTTKNTNVASDLFILPIPQSEIDGNENINTGDQNPIVQ